MKKILILKLIVLIFFVVLFENNNYIISATKCTATADNGSECSITCTEGVAFCLGGAKTVICTCLVQQPQPKVQRFELTAFAPGEREYFLGSLKPFILSLNSERAVALANALDQVILAVDQNNPELYNDAEWNYVEKRNELNEQERQLLDNWVAENGFYR